MTRSADMRSNCLAKAGLFGVTWVVPAYCLPVLAGLAGWTDASVAQPAGTHVEYAKPVNKKLNPTGRVISMSVPIKDGSRSLGEITIRLLPNDEIAVPVAKLVERLDGVLDSAALDRIRAAGHDRGETSLPALRAAGLRLRFDPGLLELMIDQGADERQAGELSLARSGPSGPSPRAAKPATVAGYLNVYTGIAHVWRDNGTERTGAQFDLQSAVRLGSVVLENDGIYDGTVDSFLCPIEARCVYDHRGGLKRRRSSIVYDMPERQTRLQLGDTFLTGIGRQRAPDVLGFSLEHAPRRFGDGRNLATTGRSSFRLERNSEVDVLVNGVIVRRLSLGPGVYNLRDLPLGSGGNDVELVITDDTGQRRALAFSTFIDHMMLAEGRTEWSLAGGVPSFIIDGGRTYRREESFASGHLRHGLSSVITVELHAQGDDRVRMGGAGTYLATGLGVVGLDGSVSDSPAGTGYAVGASWTLANFRGALFEDFGTRESLRLSVDYLSSDFRTPGESLTFANGILYPQYPFRTRMRADYTAPLGSGLTATVSGRYQTFNSDWPAISPLTFRHDRYGIDLTLSRALTPTLSGALTLGYSNEVNMRNPAGLVDNGADWRAMVRIYWRTSDRGFVTTSHDTLNRQTQLTAWQTEGRGVGRWETSVDTQHSGYDDRSVTTGSVAWFGNRADVRLQHSATSTGSPFDGFNTAPGGQRSSLRVGTAIAFADGLVSVGAPIRGDAFALFYPHESLDGRTIVVGAPDAVRGTSSGWGPAVVSNIPAYANHSIPIDVADLPVGYSLGSGTFDLYAPYKSGYALEVGSSHSVSVFGTLLQADGTPAGLVAGEAFAVSDPERRVELFTNAAGRFGVEGMAPGRWRLVLAAEDGPLTFEIEIPKGTKGLLKVGTLQPVKP